MPGLAVRDFALVGNQIVAVVVNDQAQVDVVACPGAGCSGAALVLAANEPAGVLAIEADALRAYWTTDQTVEQVSLDGQDRDVRFDRSVVGGEVQQALLREDGFVDFAA